jgi:hypothetical protein
VTRRRATHDDSVDHEENAHGEKSMNPAGALEYERRNSPYAEQQNRKQQHRIRESFQLTVLGRNRKFKSRFVGAKSSLFEPTSPSGGFDKLC